MSDILARIFRYSLHHLEHSWDNFYEDICFPQHIYFPQHICFPQHAQDLIHQRQDELQLGEKAQRDLVILALFFQELNVSSVISPPDPPVMVRTDLRSDSGKIEGNL